MNTPKIGQYKLLKDWPGYPAGTRVVLYQLSHKSVRIRNGGKSIDFNKMMFNYLTDTDWFEFEGKESS